MAKPRSVPSKMQHPEPSSFVPVSSIVFYPGNPRVHPPQQIEALKLALTEFGLAGPLQVQRSTMQVLGGNGRLTAIKELGWEKVEVKLLDIDDERAKLLNIALNGLGELSSWDNALLADGFKSLLSVKVDPIITGFTMEQIDKIVGDVDVSSIPQTTTVSAHERQLATATGHEDIKEPEAPAVPKIPMTKPGDVWILGAHRLLCADSSSDFVQKAIEDFSADVLFTDPPYGANFIKHQRDKWRNNAKQHAIANDALTGDDLKEFFTKSLGTALRLSEKAYVCCEWRSFPRFTDALGAPKSVIVWDKGYFGIGHNYRRQHEWIIFYGSIARKDLSDVWPIRRDPSARYQHPTQKPIALPGKALADCAARRVVDPFSGAGATLLAAEQLGVQALAVEMMPHYCDVIVKRWEELTGKTAIRKKGQAKEGVTDAMLAMVAEGPEALSEEDDDTSDFEGAPDNAA